MGYSLQLAARVLLYASSHIQDNTYHSLCYTRLEELFQWVHHEGSIWRPIAPCANALSTELHLAPTLGDHSTRCWCLYEPTQAILAVGLNTKAAITRPPLIIISVLSKALGTKLAYRYNSLKNIHKVITKSVNTETLETFFFFLPLMEIFVLTAK